MRYLLSEVDLLGQWLGLVVQFLVVVHPDLSCSSGVPCEHCAGPSRESVRVPLAEHVTDAGTGDNFQGTTTLPYSEMLHNETN